MSKTVGILGLGIMGGAMSTNLLADGFRVVGFDIDEAMRDALAGRSGEAATSPAAVAREADIVISSLPSPAALDAVVGGEDGLVSSGREGLIVIETSTLAIDDKQRAHDAMAAAGMILLDCPLSGTGAQAVIRDLLVYASGDRAACERCQPIFDGFARKNFYVGEFGNGSKMKFVANLLVGIHNVAAGEALLLGMKAGLDPQMIYDVVRDGAGGSRMFQVRGPMMVADDYADATMKMDVWQKDMSIITAFAESLDSPTPLLDASAKIYKEGLKQGRAKQDTASVCGVLEEMAGFKR